MFKGLDKVKTVIDKAHRYGSTRTELQGEATQAAIGYLTTLEDDVHWFCNDDIRYVVVEAMALFSFDGTDALKWLQSAFERVLNRCHQCAEKYQMSAKKELWHLTSDIYDAKGEAVDQFFKKIDLWDKERLSRQFETTCQAAFDKGLVLSDQKGPGFESATLCALFECLWYPTLCESPDFMQAFQRVFLGIQEKGKLLRVAGSILPAMYTFSFSPDKRLRDWSRKCFEKAKTQVTPAQFKTSGRAEVVKSCARLQAGTSHAPSFWHGIQMTVRYTDPGAVITELRDADLNLMDFICGEVSSMSDNLQQVARILHILLNALGVHLWASCPMAPRDLGAKIINNPKFRDILAHPEIVTSTSTTSSVDALAEVLEWSQPYVMSQFGSNKYRVATDILHAFLGPQSGTLPSVTQVACASRALKILQALLLEALSTSDKDSKRAFQIELRSLIDTFAAKVADLRFDRSFGGQEWSTVRASASEVIGLIIQSDCQILWSDFVSLSTTEYWDTKERKYTVPNFQTMWALMTRNTSEGNLDILQRFIEVVGRQLSLIDNIEIQSKMSNEVKSAVEIFNRGLNQAMSSLCAVVRAVGGTWSSSQLKEFLSRAQTNEGMIALMFSPNHEVYAEALNFLKEAYEVDGRIEALRSGFAVNFASTMQGFILVLNNWSTEGIFKSATRVVRTASNVLDILFARRNGLIVTAEVKDVPAQTFQKSWQAFWRMLETTYRLALHWAERFDKVDLIEFMRDVLECSDLLLGSYSAYEKGSLGLSFEMTAAALPEKQKQLQEVLLNECLRAIKSLTTWLRLSDMELLQSCVNLVTNILTRLAKADIRLSDDTIFIFDRLIINSKKRKNCLNAEQRSEIHLALSQHSDKLEDPDDVQILDVMPAFTKSVDGAKPTSSVYDQMQLAAARQAVVRPEKQRLPNISTKSTIRPNKALPTHHTMTPAERAEFLRKRSGELPSFLQSKKPMAKNASVGAVRKEESSASESDSGDDIEGLFAGTDKSHHKSKGDKRQTRPLETAGIQLVRRDPAAERNRIQQNIRARTNPDLTDLHMKILAWDPSHKDGYPPGQSAEDYSKLVNSYQTADRYRKAVEPLFLLETWQHIVSSHDNIKDADKFEIVLQTRSAVDNFVDLVATMSSTDWKKHIVTDPDLLMLSTSTNFKQTDDGSGLFCLAKVQSMFKKKDIVEIGLRTVPNAAMVKHLRPTVQLFVVKLSGLTPIHREYATLKALPYYDLCDEIVLGKPTRGLSSHQSEVDKLIKAYGVNEPQAKAIDAALQNTGFTLIQGPPGTGKTKTILGMVGAFLSQSRTEGTAISLPGQQQVKKAEVKKKKILLCAPSNAAVDEIVLRLKNGINTSQGEKYIPKIVRMGMSDAINVNVQDVTLDALLDDMLNRADDKMTGSHSNDPTALRDKLNEVLRARDEQRALLNKARAENEDASKIEAEIRKLNNQKTQLGERLDVLRDKQSQKARAKDIERKRFQSQILADADVICATLSGSGHELMASIAVDFETVIIDEACQTTELSALIPLKYGCTRCIMVGDPNQLPPTVLSTEAVKFAYNESLFVRMQRNNSNAVRLLAIQYRMHSTISKFPSDRFYNGHLLDGPEVDTHTKRAWHNSTIFGTYRFFDIRGREEQSNKFSVYNLAEAKAALAIVQRLKEDFFDVDFDGRIGIITPYKEQHNQIRRLFQKHYGQNVLSIIDFNTIDGFQGQEKDIIIFSCVRANETRGIGFLSDRRRMNVGLTRAKSSVFILGHAAALKTNETWRALVDDATARNLYTQVTSSTFSTKTRTQQKTTPNGKNANGIIKNRPESPTRTIKEEVKSERPVPQFDDTNAPIQNKPSILQTVKPPAKLLANSNVAKVPAVRDSASTITKTEHVDIDHRPNPSATSGNSSTDNKREPTLSNPAKSVSAIHFASAKRKSEPSLFIKRKKPAK